jgi:hypothetical protein
MIPIGQLSFCGARLQPRHLADDFKAALQAAERLPCLVGYAFRHDIAVVFPSGVLTPKGKMRPISAASLRAEASVPA